jgi:hypothetical protein
MIGRFAGSYQCQKNSSHTTITARYNAKIILMAHPSQKGPFEISEGNQCEHKHWKFASQHEEVLPPISLDRRLADPWIRVR